MPLPDETAILNFRHLLARHALGEELFTEINRQPAARGLRLRECTIVDAAVIAAPSSTQNRAGARDPEMRQTRKGRQWHFGMKAHIGVDARTGLVHSLAATSADAHDVTQAHRLLHGGETAAWGAVRSSPLPNRADQDLRDLLRPSLKILFLILQQVFQQPIQGFIVEKAEDQPA